VGDVRKQTRESVAADAQLSVRCSSESYARIRASRNRFVMSWLQSSDEIAHRDNLIAGVRVGSLRNAPRYAREGGELADREREEGRALAGPPLR